MSNESENPEVIVAVPAASAVAEFPEPVRITNPDGSSWSMRGTAAWTDAGFEVRPRDEPVSFGPLDDDGPDDECEGAP